MAYLFQNDMLNLALNIAPNGKDITNMDAGNTLNTFGARLKMIREAIRPKLSQQALGERLGQTEQSAQPHISKLEKDVIDPSITELILISEIFNVSIDWLLGSERKSEGKLQTFADIIQMLFDIDEATYISINPCEKEYMETGCSGYPELYEKTVHQICFEEHFPFNFYLDDFLKSWKETKDYLAGRNSEVGKKMYELWKRDQLERSSKIKLQLEYIDCEDGFSVIPDDLILDK